MQRLTPLNWLGIQAWSGLLALAVLCGLTSSARAVMIFDSTSNTTLFYDNFEGQTTGSPPSTANMQPTPVPSGSSWSVLAPGGTRTSRNVINTALTTPQPSGAPGPYQGSKYLLVNIPKGTTGFGTSLSANFNAPAMGDTLAISFAYAWGTGGTTGSGDVGNGSGGPQLKLEGADGISIFMDSGGGFFNFYGPADNYDQPIASSTTAVKGALGAWHKFLLSWVQGSSNVTLTVDGTTEVITGALNGSAPGWVPTDLNLTTTRAGVIAFDAYPVPVPEPATLSLVGLAIVGLFGVRKNRR